MISSNYESADLVSIIRREIDNARYGVNEFDDKQKAMNYYLGKPRGDEVEGKSSVQSRDVADMLEATVAAIAPSFTNKYLVEVEPVAPDDEERAYIESQFVNYALVNWNNGYVQLQQCLRDALLFRNCVAKIHKDIKIETETLEFDEPVDEYTILNIQQQLKSNQTLHLHNEQLIHVQTETSKVCFESVPIEEFLFTSAWNEPTLEECPFTAHHRLIRKRELIEMGFDYDEVIDLPSTEGLTGTTGNEDTSSLRQEEPYDLAVQKIEEKVEIYECYLYLDIDGYIQMYQVYYTEGRIIGRPTPVNYHPFAGGTCILMPHRFIGLSLYDQLRDIQDIKTFSLRQYLDNINNNNNRRLEVEVPLVYDINDVVESRPGGLIRVKKLGAVSPIPVDDIGSSIQSLLGYMDKIRADRAGATLDMQNENIPVGENRTAHGAERLVSSKEMVAAALMQVFADTFLKSAAILVHKVLAFEFNEELSLKLGNEWFRTNPANEWLKARSININTLPSLGEQFRKSQALTQVLGYQQTAIEKGENEILTNRQGIYAALLDLTKSLGLTNPNKYWVNPDSQQAQQAIQQQSQQASQQSAEQQKAQNTMLQNEVLKTKILEERERAKSLIEGLRAKLEEAKIAADNAKENAQLQFDYDKLHADLAMQLTSLETQYNTDIERGEFKENLGETQ